MAAGVAKARWTDAVSDARPLLVLPKVSAQLFYLSGSPCGTCVLKDRAIKFNVLVCAFYELQLLVASSITAHCGCYRLDSPSLDLKGVFDAVCRKMPA